MSKTITGILDEVYAAAKNSNLRVESDIVSQGKYYTEITGKAQAEIEQIIAEQVIGEGRQLLLITDDKEHWNGAYANVSEQCEKLKEVL